MGKFRATMVASSVLWRAFVVDGACAQITRVIGASLTRVRLYARHAQANRWHGLCVSRLAGKPETQTGGRL